MNKIPFVICKYAISDISENMMLITESDKSIHSTPMKKYVRAILKGVCFENRKIGTRCPPSVKL